MDTPTIPTTGRCSCGDCCTKIEHLYVTLGGHQVLHDVNLHIHCGQLAAVIGPNGGGKTTLLRAMIGEVPYHGAIRNALSKVRGSHPLSIGYVPQKLDLDASAPVTVADLFSASLSSRPVWLGSSRRVAMLAATELARVGAGDLLNARLGTLSGGQLQRVLLALALTPAPDLLLLDEPVSGVDPSGIELFYHMVSQLRQRHHLAIVLVSHDIATAARYADRMLFLDKTFLCDGRPDEVLGQEIVVRTFGRFEVPNRGERPAETEGCL